MTYSTSAFVKAVSKNWRMLVGKPSEFVLETRLFHSISLLAILLVIPYFPYNLYAGMYTAAFSCMVFAGVFCYEYYRSRFRHLPHRILVFGISGLIILGVNYFANAGIEGSTDLIWPCYLLLVLTICPKRQQLAWLIVYLVVFGLIHVAEHQFPEWVRYPFRVGHGQFQDRITAFPLPVITIAIVIGMFRRNYDRERAMVAQRDAEKTRLLSILSHDLRAPFTQVRQYLELLDDDTLSITDRARMEGILRQSNDQTLDLVTNLLYWSRSQLEGASVKLVELNLLDTLKNTLSIATALAAQKGISLKQNIDPKAEVTGDADMLQLVVRNVLQNAIKFSSNGSEIKIDAAIAHHRCGITISDTGTGIGPEQLATLFTGATMPTYGTANEKGVGLGLQLCHEFMEKQGGGISVESKLGEGSRFTIELPAA